MVSFIPSGAYVVRMVIIGIIILGFGIWLSVIANVVMNSGEAFVRAVSWKIDKDFGNVKIVFDVTSAARSLILSLLFFDFKIARTRKGTIIFALMTGVVVKYFNGKLRKPVDSEC